MKMKNLNLMKMNISIGDFFKSIVSLFFLSVIIVGCSPKSIQPKLEVLNTNVNSLIIGLEKFNDSTAWASGTAATILKTTDAGENWTSFNYPEIDSLQFRDIQPISDKEAIVLSAGEGELSKIFYFHEQSGWNQVFQMQNAEGFIDAVQFWGNGQGLVYGDAIDSLAYILKTTNFGRSWERIPTAPMANEGEGGFASSGSNILIEEGGEAWIATGANGSARVFYTQDYGRSWEVKSTPMITGEFAGLTAIKKTPGKLWITGGDLAIADQVLDNVFFSEDNGNNWTALPQHNLKGSFYGLAVTNYLENDFVIACGPNGAEIWLGDQQKWQILAEEDIWTAKFIDARTALMAGRDGKMFKVVLE